VKPLASTRIELSWKTSETQGSEDMAKDAKGGSKGGSGGGKKGSSGGKK
jgi:hypothetical protein